MRKIYQKAIIMLSVACMGYATPAFAADAVVKDQQGLVERCYSYLWPYDRKWHYIKQHQGKGLLLFFCQSDANGGGWNKQDLSV